MFRGRHILTLLACLFGSQTLVAGTSDSLLTLDGEDLDVIVIKIGGSSLTNKAVKEEIDEENLNWFSSTLSSTISEAFLSPKIDEKQCEWNTGSDDEGGCVRGTKKHAFVVVHGAGSFGHHTAKEYGLKGQLEYPSTNSSELSRASTERRRVMKGVAETRLSVQELNRLVVSNLVEHGINAVGVSPCFSIPGMQAHGGGMAGTNLRPTIDLNSVIQDSLQAGLVPVLHGDACLYGYQNAGILSGDKLMEIIGRDSWVTNVIFLTDVDGVFTRDPREDHNAELLRHIEVDSESLDIISPVLDVSGSSHAHDVTGGLKTKLGSAAAIAASGRNVTIVKTGSVSAEQVIHQKADIEKATVIFSNERL